MKKGNIISGSFFVFRYIKQEYSQYAFVVPKKIAKTAVKRNSMRRVGYNILRTINPQLNAGIFFYKKEALGVSLIEIKKDIISIFIKASVK